MNELTSKFTALPGGVMTDEVGVITGDLELRTRHGDGVLTAEVRYDGALEWYSVTGANCKLYDERDHECVHTVLRNVLHREPIETG
ncbi:hypothetical protein [Allokutzneria albata]|uniref:Uncharacterized protein n=1 Tax=Allokutzneria albata TaxID=211114 RepID=A0A1G9ZNK1_ALLAB|nr:hypothetical protein [Allokutzneria albata]SDN22256.1 hypothetical protein SAMN04489726_5586 [Allokutzneria albata]